MSKQVNKSESSQVSSAISPQDATLPPPADTNDRRQPVQKSLFVRVDTFDVDGRPHGSRIVNMYHQGTTNWIRDHLWWATHNGCTIEVNCATDEEVGAYMEEQKLALAARFNHDHRATREQIAS